MSLVAAWVLFPAVLLLLATGAGLLVERIAGTRLPGALIPAIGIGLIVVSCQFLTLAEWTAELIVPVAVFLALLGGLLAGSVK